MSYLRQILFFIILTLIPAGLILAADTSGLVTCGFGTQGPESCTLISLIKMVKGLLDFITLYIISPLAVILIIWAGMQMVIYGHNNPSKAQAGKKILQNVLIGYAIILGAYLIVKQVLDFFANTNSNSALFQAYKVIQTNFQK